MKANTTFSATQLFTIMVNRGSVVVNGTSCLIQAIAMEDGSGKSFNVTFQAASGKPFVKFVRTRS